MKYASWTRSTAIVSLPIHSASLTKIWRRFRWTLNLVYSFAAVFVLNVWSKCTAVQRNTLITDQNVHAKNCTNRVSNPPALDLLHRMVHKQIRFAHWPNQVCSPTKSGFVCLPAYLSVCLSACLSACLPACLFYPVQQILIFNDSSTNSTHHLQTGFYFLVLLPSFSSLCKLKYSSLHGVPSGFIFGSVLWQILEWYFGFFT